MPTEQKRKLTQAEKAVLKEGYPVDTSAESKPIENEKDIVEELQQMSKQETKPWWKKVLEFIGDIVLGVVALIASPFMKKKKEDVIIDLSGLENGSVYQKANEEIKRQTKAIEKDKIQDEKEQQSAEVLEITPEVVEEPANASATVISDEQENAMPDAVVEDTAAENVSEQDTPTTESETTAIEEDGKKEFVATRCGSFEELQESIRNISENIALSVTSDNVLRLQSGEHSVDFVMDELNADGLKECIQVDSDIANAVTAQMEENTTIIKLKLEEKSVSELVEKLSAETDKTKLIELVKELCDTEDKIKDIKIDTDKKTISFDLNIESGFDMSMGQCVQNLVQISLSDKPTIKQAQEFNNPMTGGSKHIGPEKAELSKLPITIRAIAQFFDNEKAREILFAKEKSEQEVAHESLRQFRNKKMQEKESNNMTTVIPKINLKNVTQDSELVSTIGQAYHGVKGVNSVSVRDDRIIFNMPYDTENDKDENGRGCIGDTIKIAIATGKIEREKTYADSKYCDIVDVAFEMKPDELPPIVKVAYDELQAPHIQEMFSAAREVFDEKPKRKVNEYEESYGYESGHRDSKKGHDRRPNKKQMELHKTFANGELPEKRADKHKRMAKENNAKFLSGINARENGEDR